MTSAEARPSFPLRVNRLLFYGWVMLAVAALGLFASGAGQSYTFSVFVLPLSEQLGLSRTTISSAYALGTLVAAFGLTFVGRLIDRWGNRVMLALIGLLLGAAAMGFAAVTTVAALFVGFTALRFLGQGSLMLACNNLVAQWFSRRRGFALSLAALGFSASMAAYPPAAQWLINTVGWRQTWLWVGLATWVLVVPASALLVRNRPEALGLQPDGVTTGPAGLEAATGTPTGATAEAGLTLRDALRTPVFWVVATALANVSMLVTGMAFHQVSIFENQGLAPQTAANIFPITAGTMVVVMPLWGTLLDRVPTRLMLSASQLLQAAAMYMMLATDDPTTAVAYSLVFGVFNASLIANGNYVWPAYFGRRYLGSIQGAAKTVGVVGASIGPLPFGIAYDLLGGYTEALVVLSALPLAFAVAVLFTRPQVGSAA